MISVGWFPPLTNITPLWYFHKLYFELTASSGNRRRTEYIEADFDTACFR